jgi:predicted Zn finger-like uncharacterized protein
MSLATSCPACGTTFRVIEDQLQASEGWVRCGQCHQIFDALERLFDLEQAQAPVVASSPQPSTPHEEIADAGDEQPTIVAALEDEPEAGWAETRPALFGDEHSVLLQPSQPLPTATTTQPPLTFSDGGMLHLLASVGSAVPAHDAAARPTLPTDIENDATSSATVFLVEPGMAGDSNDIDADADHQIIQKLEPSTAPAVVTAAPIAAITPPAPVPAPAPVPLIARSKSSISTTPLTTAGAGAHGDKTATERVPAFVRKANQEARWRKPWIRVLLGIVGLMVLGLLIAQASYQWRDLIAAKAPVLRPWLAQGCQWLDCRLEPPRVLEAVVVDNTALTRPPGMMEGYRLSIALRNKADHEIAAPSMELTLTDTANAVLSRRVLNPSDFGVTQAALSAQADAAWQLVFLSNDARITGYTVRAFYP